MKKTRYTEEQIIGILKESDAGIAPGELCRKCGFSRSRSPISCEGDQRSPEVDQRLERSDAGGTSVSEVIDMIKSGLEAQEQERGHFLGLIDELASAKAPADRKRIKDELARITFGE